MGLTHNPVNLPDMLGIHPALLVPVGSSLAVLDEREDLVGRVAVMINEVGSGTRHTFPMGCGARRGFGWGGNRR